jgi:hypothetical protein
MNTNGLIDIEMGNTIESNNELSISTQKKIRTLGLSKAIKLFTIFDLIFIIFYSLVFYWPCIFILIPILSGYYSTTTFNKNYLIPYIIFIIVYTGFKIYLLFNSSIFIFNVISFISICSGIYLLNLIRNYYNNLLTLSIEEINELISGWTPRVIRIVYY